MSSFGSPTRRPEEARFELAMAAAARERANTPRTLVLASLALLAVAAGALALAMWSRAGAMSAYATERDTQTLVRTRLEDYKAIRQQAQTGDDRGPFPGMATRLNELAIQAGLRDSLSNRPPSMTERPSGRITVKDYKYHDITDPSLRAILEWMRLATAEVPGLEISDVSLKPTPTAWVLQVTFRRWERAS